MNPELVLVVGDMFVPQRSPDISDQFKSILIPNKLQHVLSLGNIGSRESNDWLKSLSNDFHQGQFRVPFLTLCQTQPLRLCLW